MRQENRNFKTNISLVDFLYLTFYFSFILLLSYWSMEIFSVSIPSNFEQIIFPWILISFIFAIIGFFLIHKTTFSDIAIWYILVSYFFMFGHVFLEIFDLKTSLLWNPGTFFHPNDKLRGAVYALMSLNFISFGYFLHSTFKKENYLLLLKRKNKLVSDTNMLKVGLIIFVIGFICNVINSFIIVTSTYRAGSYTAYAEIAGSTGFIGDFAYLLIPGTTFILCSRKLSLNSARFFTVIISLLYLVIMVFSGSRKTQLFSILAILICYAWVYGTKKIKISTIFNVTVLSFLLLNLIYIIREYRTNLSQILPAFIESIIHLDFLREIFGETFAETGLSMYSVVSIVKYVPHVFNYEFGLTFLRATLAIFPLGGIFPIFFKKGFSTFLINTYTGIPVGSSLIGDFYWNFGFVGALILSFLFGILLSRVAKLKYKNGYSEPIYFSILFTILICIRAGLMDITRPLIIITIIPLIIKEIMVRKKENRR
ncbi:O-antigen polymerase [Streptococcus uberis]|uniref:O-antigen polymerase n=1 Tax=Streptococcus uberis TaxID=1349 RepID=UPI0020BDB8E9|nr:O-antigen polymerase [Streptococcus uberis]